MVKGLSSGASPPLCIHLKDTEKAVQDMEKKCPIVEEEKQEEVVSQYHIKAILNKGRVNTHGDLTKGGTKMLELLSELDKISGNKIHTCYLILKK